MVMTERLRMDRDQKTANGMWPKGENGRDQKVANELWPEKCKRVVTKRMWTDRNRKVWMGRD